MSIFNCQFFKVFEYKCCKLHFHAVGSIFPSVVSKPQILSRLQVYVLILGNLLEKEWDVLFRAMDIGLDFAIKAMYGKTLDILGCLFGLFWQYVYQTRVKRD